MYSDGHRIVQQQGERSVGGAFEHYRIIDNDGNELVDIPMQNGPIPQVGVIGATNECLIAVAIDRLEGFQHGSFPCDENVAAIKYLKAALAVLEIRTADRIRRKVEGKYEA